MFTIYGRPNSSNVRKVLWLCEEIGQTSYERVDYGRGFKPIDSPEYVTLNPNKLVPTLVDGDLVLWESNTILRYLAGTYGRQDIYPADLAARAKVDMWLDWQLTTALGGIRRLFQGLHIKDEAYTDPADLEKAQAQAANAMGILDAHLARGSAYVAADSLTIADCALGMFVHRWYALPVEREDFAALASYYERLKERAAFRKWILEQGV